MTDINHDISDKKKNGLVGIETAKLEGFLCALLIKSDNRISITIMSEEGYLIYQNKEFAGQEAVYVRTQAVDQYHHIIGFSSECFHLSEKLNVLVEGPVGFKVQLTFRMETE